MKYLTEKQFRANKQALNEYTVRTIQEANDEAVQINKYWPCSVWYAHSEEEGKLFYEFVELRLKHEHLTLVIRSHKKGSKTYYTIACKELQRVGDKWSVLQNVSLYDVDREKKSLQEPNRIGVLTTKKIQDWAEYYDQLFTALQKLDEQQGGEKAAFLKKIEKEKIDWHHTGKKGEIRKNGLVFKFEISESHISERIEIDYRVSNSFENFQLLANNKYKDED